MTWPETPNFRAAWIESGDDSASAHKEAAEQFDAWLAHVIESAPRGRAFERIVQAFRESIDPEDGIVNDPHDIFDLIDQLAVEQGLSGAISQDVAP